MKKIPLALMLCLVSIYGNSESRIMHTGEAFHPTGVVNHSICHFGWKSEASLAISEIFMLNNETARLVLNQAKEETTFYVSNGDKVYFYYFSGLCFYYSFYKDTSYSHYEIKTYTISNLKNNEMTITLDE